ncbi:two-component hybrid sensor and regulator [Ameyamaea chiangmaiensis NBRC 103196]|uniref:histidine kinase n=1 Tax=Ameyamaea chiangmaiensis TaxID=442969 RepID=A0A850PE54_9PROT|nr:CHASE3 domain-containing protein [Ameyamaea chiangmaiensis]MBS4074735.1 CHASE3 domain-containing protein [Ameyamaea chiangmaiensis]NVN40222.1 CHASE3 domain-containing protein [Ameyamaea chiangmaiensis]GBQ62550.1 two-component hybrid sensor and regulator [Ameyamaea chiangmaiensis NBRC 103196]
MTRHMVARANLLVMGVLMALLGLISGAIWIEISAARDTRLWTQHTNDVLLTLQDIGITMRDAERGQRGFLLTGRPDYIKPYDQALAHVTRLTGQLQRLTADDAVAMLTIVSLEATIQRKLAELAETIAIRKVAGSDKALDLVNSDLGQRLMIQIDDSIRVLRRHESQILENRQITADRRASRMRWLMLAVTVVSALALLWAARTLTRAWADSIQRGALQKALAQQLRSTLDNLTQGVAVFSAEATLVNWNARFQEVLGLPKALLREGMTYVALADYLAEAEGGTFLETEEQIRIGRSLHGATVGFERTRLNGPTLEFRRSAVPGGGFVLTVTDMTKRAQAESVLRESQKMQAIGQLTGGIAHDFNNLLTVILGNLALVQSRLDDQPRLQEKLGRATWAAQRGATLTQQLLAFARKQPLSPLPIDLSHDLPNLVPLLSRTLGEHIDVRYVERAGLWLAMADAAQLENAVLNLALNARDAMPNGGHLTIETANVVLDDDYATRHAEVAPGDYAMVAVSDTGHGMSPEVQARVFEPFFTTKPEGKGTGLGLAMVFGFVKQSGGHVKIYSEVGEGTTVRLYLPRATAAVQVAAPVAPVELPRIAATILVVEDEADVRQITVEILRDFGYRVLEAADGAEGMRILGTQVGAIDLLLTDVVLPGDIRGRDLAERLSAMRPEVPILFMSGYTENSIVHHGRLDDGVNLIGKPFTREQLARRIAGLLTAGPAASSVALPRDENVVELRQVSGGSDV